MKIFLVRHGLSALNGKKVHQIRDDPLTEQGKRQARSVASRLAEVNADLIVSSSYPRAAETARIIGKRLKKRIIYTELLKEWKKPSEIEGKSRSDRKANLIYNKIMKNIDRDDWHYSDEENLFDLKERIKSIGEYLEGKNGKNSTLIVVTHAKVIYMMLAIAVFGVGVTSDEYIRLRKAFALDNTGITEVEMVDGLVTKVITLNDVTHLKDIAENSL